MLAYSAIPIRKEGGLETRGYASNLKFTHMAFTPCHRLGNYRHPDGCADITGLPVQSPCACIYTDTTGLAILIINPTRYAHSLVSHSAFDTVNHQILIYSLGGTGCGRLWLNLISSYLNNHTHYVTWRGPVSEPGPLTTGVPKPSVLGPLLLPPLYTNSNGLPLTRIFLPQLFCLHPTTAVFPQFRYKVQGFP